MPKQCTSGQNRNFYSFITSFRFVFWSLIFVLFGKHLKLDKNQQRCQFQPLAYSLDMVYSKVQIRYIDWKRE